MTGPTPTYDSDDESFEVTDEARYFLADMLSDASAPAHVSLRLYLENNSLKLALDQLRDDDLTFVYGHRTVLTVNAEIANRLGGTILDRDDSHGASKLVLIAQG